MYFTIILYSTASKDDSERMPSSRCYSETPKIIAQALLHNQMITTVLLNVLVIYDNKLGFRNHLIFETIERNKSKRNSRITYSFR